MKSMARVKTMKQISSLTQFSISRQLFDDIPNKRLFSSVIESHPFVCNHMKTFSSSINYMDIDSIDHKFLLMGYNDGNIEINEIDDQNSGHFCQLFNKKLSSAVNRCQWYSVDTGMFDITSSDSVTLIDTNTQKKVEKYSFGETKLYWSDWSSNLTSCIAVGCSSSTIRIIDIRSGSSLHNITCCSKSGSVNHKMTRIVWSPLDSDCLIAGDSSGFLHIYDIRRSNKSVRILGSDYTSFEPITSLQFTKDKMSVVTTHGLSNKLNLWQFIGRDLINSNINFECPLVRSKQTKQNLNTSYIRCQLFITDDYIFAPTEVRQFGRDVIGYDITNGTKVHSLSTSREGTFNAFGPNCVTGLDFGSGFIYSAGNQRLCIWSPKIDSEEDRKRLNKYYSDRWSDSE